MNNTTSQYPPSYYAATRNKSIISSPCSNNDEFETCIIGGGYAGLATALGLIERGHTSVLVIEQHHIGWGASGRNGGFVFGGYSLGPRALVKQVGLEKARELYSMTTDAVELIRQRITNYKIDCDLVDEGVILANWFKDQSLLMTEQEFMHQQMNVEWQYIAPELLREKINTDRYCGGLFEPNAMHFHPLNYALAIAEQVQLQGGSVIEQTEVLGIDYSETEKRITTKQGVFRCKNIVIAGGGYMSGGLFSGICPPVNRSILPIATYVMATESLGDDIAEYFKTKAAIYDTRFAFDYYRPLNDQRILWGGRISASTRRPVDLEQKLRADLVKVFPDLAGVIIDYVWDGMMSYSQHQMAQIGQLQPGVWYGVGFGGHGVVPTTVAGEVLAAAITNENNHYQKFQPWGLPWNGGPAGPVAAQLSYWWYQLKDYLKEKLE
ncbi:MAG: FAD-binding oxidoreductase [Kangiellaceae bacterium]|jgi:gamma-glutamylputrescine oxidase|nr:FAD-binding oxidoreductase [Kangiellaceae bacterium]